MTNPFFFFFLEGGLIVQEAGGKFSDMIGHHIEYSHAKSEHDKFSVLGSNGHLHEIVLEKFEKVRKNEGK